MSRYTYDPGDAEASGSVGSADVLILLAILATWYYVGKAFYSGRFSSWAHHNPWLAIAIVMFWPAILIGLFYAIRH